MARLAQVSSGELRAGLRRALRRDSRRDSRQDLTPVGSSRKAELPLPALPAPLRAAVTHRARSRPAVTSRGKKEAAPGKKRTLREDLIAPGVSLAAAGSRVRDGLCSQATSDGTGGHGLKGKFRRDTVAELQALPARNIEAGGEDKAVPTCDSGKDGPASGESMHFFHYDKNTKDKKRSQCPALAACNPSPVRTERGPRGETELSLCEVL
ncbi:uncharacterized protein LOC115308022 [Manacus vitellinus]|uniref:uncharacterized protein LOC115308022 n=1 Tax=Manacus vitellinus TaxID=328815 RepID=UPI00115EAAA2|nr:uncharacterized protein LOC115308022 [Manacus vitellinus]